MLPRAPRVSFTRSFFYLANYRPRAAAAPRPYATAQPPLTHNSTVPPPSPCSATARALQRRARTAPAPCLRHLCAADHAPPPSKSSTTAYSASTPSPRAVHLHPPLNLLTRRELSSPCPSHLVLICTQGVRQIVSKIICVVFVGFPRLIYQGMILTSSTCVVSLFHIYHLPCTNHTLAQHFRISFSVMFQRVSTSFHVIGSNQIFILTLYDRWLVTRKARVRW